MLEKLKVPNDLRNYWVELQELVGPGKVSNIMYREPHQVERLDRVVQLARDLGGLTCVELGCCEGQMTAPLAKHFQEVIAMDFIPELLRECPHLENVTYVCEDLEEFNPSHYYDVVVMSELLEHVRDPRALVQRWAPHAGAIIASCPVNELPNDHTFNVGRARALLDGEHVEAGDASGHVWVMDEEGFKSLFDGLDIFYYDRYQSCGILGARWVS